MKNTNKELGKETKDLLTRLKKSKLEKCNVELIGKWVWVSGETKQYTEKLKKLCNDRNIEGLEVSAKTGINIEESFETLAKLIIGNKSKEEFIKTYTIQTKARGISITSKNKKKKKKCC